MKGFIPKLLITFTALCFGSAIILEYHEDQIAANKVLAQKVKVPEAVALQDFDVQGNSNAINEIHLMAEVKPERQVILNIGNADTARWVHVMPLYAVSPDAMPLVEAHINEHSTTPRRPVPRADAMLVAQQSNLSVVRTAQPMAFAIREIPGGDLTDFKLGILGESFGTGSIGDLVEVIGARLSSAELASQMTSSLAPYGVEVTRESFFVEPFEPGHKGTYVVPDYSFAQSVLVITGAVLSLITMAFMFGILPWKKRQPPVRPQNVEAVGHFPSVDMFEPILSQEELAADQEVERKLARSISRVA